MNIDKIELVNNIYTENDPKLSIFISGYTEKYENVNYKIFISDGGYLESKLQIMRVKKDLIDEENFKKISFSGIDCIRNGTYKMNDKYNKITESKLYGRKIILSQIFNINADEIYKMSNEDILRENNKLSDITFSKALGLLLKISIEIINTDTGKNVNILNNSVIILDEFNKIINYKKILYQQIFGKYKFSEFKNFDYMNDDWCKMSLYFELDDYRYCILKYS